MAWIRNSISYVRMHISLFAGVGVATACTVSLLPETVFLSKYKKILAHIGPDENELLVDTHTKGLIEKVLQRILLKAEEEGVLEFFTCFSSDPIHKGSTKMRFGAEIGLPGTFAYTEVTDVKKDELLLRQHSIDWKSEHGEALLKAIVLSDKAKAFAIAREINYASFHQIHMQALMRILFGMLAYSSGHILNKMFHFNQRLRVWARFSLYSVVGSAWFLFYVTLMDTYWCFQDNSADRKAAHLTKSYAEGGVEYYGKLLARNQAIRTLMGSQGERQFTLYGNVASTWRRDHVQLTTRLDNLKKYLKEYEDKASDSEQNINLD